jgi:two-component system chemotaxis response regulator CheY
VLVVEDDEDSREMYRLMLTSSGFDVIQAENGADALAKAITHLPSIVLTDLKMAGDVTAVDVCRHFAAVGVPVIAITGVSPGREHLDIRSAGCAAVLLKPVAPDVIISEVKRILMSPRAPSNQPT